MIGHGYPHNVVHFLHVQPCGVSTRTSCATACCSKGIVGSVVFYCFCVAVDVACENGVWAIGEKFFQAGKLRDFLAYGRWVVEENISPADTLVFFKNFLEVIDLLRGDIADMIFF